MSRNIQINCVGSSTAKLEDLKPIQGNLKSLSDDNYEKFKKELKKQGFTAPFFVWKDKKTETLYILDGHQRHATLLKMQTEGYLMSEFPIVDVKAKNIKEARMRVLGYVSQYGKVEGDGLYDFMKDADIVLKDLDNFDLPDFNIKSFGVNFFDEEEDTVRMASDTSSMVGNNQYIVSVNCRNETDQQEIYQELEDRGFKCVLIS